MEMTIEHVIAPPRSGKSTRCVELIEKALYTDPSTRVGYATYGIDLARDKVRHLWLRPQGSAVDRNPFPLGARTAIAGRGFDLIVLDDLIKDAEASESKAVLENILHWLKNTVATRLYPNGRVFSIASDEQQMRMVVSAFGDWGVHVTKAPVRDADRYRAQVGDQYFRQFYQGEPRFTLED